MPTATAKFDSYKVWYYSTHGAFTPYQALVYCYLGGTFIGRMEFHESDIPSVIVNGRPYVRYRIERFQDVYQILLNDSPLTLFVNDAHGLGLVGAEDFEVVGQEE